MYSYNNAFSKLQYNINELIYDIEIMVQKVFMFIFIIAAICFVLVILKKRHDLRLSGLYVGVGKNKASGIIFGKTQKLGAFIFSKEEREGHVICLGPSGTGKTSALLIPSLNNWQGTSFTIDISGDISENTICDNKALYEPENSKTIPFDIFHAIDILCSNSEKNIALEKIAHALVPELPPYESSGGAKYYNDGGRDIITAALIAYYHQGYDFIDICNKIAETGYITLFDEIDKSKNETAIKYINQFGPLSRKSTS